jgi:hypothetical protein
MPEIVCYRAAAYRTPTRVRAHDRPGRFHRLDSPPTQYFALHPLGPWAEMIRNRGYTQPDDALALRPPIWDLRLVLPEDPVRVDFEAAAGGTTPAPIAPEDLVADDQAGCRQFADAIRADQSAPRVLRVPSAALPGADNIVVFGPRRTIEYLRRPRREQQVPAAVGAVAGRALESILPLIRHRGDPHAGYEAWAAGEQYELPELDPIGLEP